MNCSDFAYGFRICGDCRQPRRWVNAAKAFFAYAEVEEAAEPHAEGYLSAFQFADDFPAFVELRSGSVKGYAGACWSPWLWFDIDRDDDLDGAARDARRLTASVVDRYGVDGDALLCFYSGSKGFHVGIPSSLWAPEPSQVFHRVARAFAERLAEQVGVAIDAGVYDRVRAFRAPNSLHPRTGRHKRRLSFDELLGLSVAAILEMAESPEPFDIPAATAVCSQAGDDWAKATEAVVTRADEHQRRRAERNGSASLNRATLALIRDGASVAVGDRHRMLFSAAANLAEFGCSESLAHALLTESGLDSGLPPAEVRRQIDCGLRGTGA